MDISSGNCRTERASPRRWGFAVLAATLIALGGPAAAEPMDLGNAQARWVTVRFEISPAELPGQFDSVYGPPLTAWLEAEAGTTRMRLTIPGAAVEANLVDQEDPIPGSFSDFVWTFDAETGHVHSAAVEGTVMRTLDWGLVTTRTKARLRFQMDTLRSAGYRKPRSVLGQPVNYFCDPEARRDCTQVRPRRYDPVTGYVNAVGPIEVENTVLGVRTFSTLGEAVFSEREAPRRVAQPRRTSTGVSTVIHSLR